jgi:hypothetical protein
VKSHDGERVLRNGRWRSIKWRASRVGDRLLFILSPDNCSRRVPWNLASQQKVQSTWNSTLRLFISHDGVCLKNWNQCCEGYNLGRLRPVLISRGNSSGPLWLNTTKLVEHLTDPVCGRAVMVIQSSKLIESIPMCLFFHLELS